MATTEHHQIQLLQQTWEHSQPFLIKESSAERVIAMTTVNGEYEAMSTAAASEDPNIDDQIAVIAHSAPPPLIDAESQPQSQPLTLRRTRSVSDKLKQTAPVLFLKHHGQKMIGKSTPDEHERGAPHWTNWMVAVSCSCFILPSMLIMALRAWNSVRRCIIFDCAYFIIVSICSFLSDYVYCWSNEKTCIDFVTLDQWTATGGVIVVIVGIVVNPYPIIVRIIDFILLLGAIYCIGKSRQAMDKYEWRKKHCIWHLYCGLTISGLYVQEYYLHKGVIPATEVWWPVAMLT